MRRVWTSCGLAGVLLGVAPACRDPSVEDVQIEDPSGYHQREGYTQIVPSVHLPSSSDDLDQVQVWIRIPPGQTISARRDANGRVQLRFPAGTIADRVEFAGQDAGRFVADVRGAEVLASGQQRFHAYRPIARQAGATLIGVQWPAANPQAQAAATDRLIERVKDTSPANTLSEDRLTKLIASIRKKNECAPCHVQSRATNTRPGEHGLVNRGTDDSGFFTPSTALADSIALEQYGAFDRSLRDGAIRIECSGQPVEAEQLQHRRCPDGTVAIGVWDPKAAQQIDPRRFKAVCESRRFVYERLDDEAKKLVGSIDPC